MYGMRVRTDRNRSSAAARWYPRRSIVIMVLAAITALACVSIEFRRRQDLYWYDVGQDYRFRFTGTGSTRVSVDVSRDGFVFPGTHAVWDTAVLRMRVDSRFLARWFEPSITVEGGGTTSRQFFERGARGQRYVLVPAAAVRSGGVVHLRGHGLHWSAQRAELLLWDNSASRGAKVLVLAPHPDDAEIAAFGLYSANNSVVVTVTAGNYVDRDYAHLYADGAARETLTGRVRTWDSLVVPVWGGVPPDRTANLGYLGLSLERLYADRETAPATAAPTDSGFGRYRRGAVQQLLRGRTATPAWSSLVDDLVTLLQTVQPDVIVAPHPVLDGSVDHQLTTAALLEALDKEPRRTLLFLYSNHHVLTEYYPFGPSDSDVTLPPWFDSELPFTSVYSHALDERTQMDKLFALDANHDLRGAPRRLLGGPADRFAMRASQSITELVRDPVADYSYFRRAVRPNELFFVYTSEDRKSLAAALAAYRRTRRLAALR
jgi:LmbE family N-acetylglucosaminyl deacetylase